MSSLGLHAQNISENIFASNQEGMSVPTINVNDFYDYSETDRIYKNINNALETERAQANKMTKVGRVLTFVGLPLIVIGGIMVSNADEYYYECVNGVCEGDPQGAFGSLILAGGIGLTGTGVVLWTIGANK